MQIQTQSLYKCNTKKERKQETLLYSDIEQLKNAIQKMKYKETSKKHNEIKDKEANQVKRCGDKAGEGTFTFGKMPGRGNRRKPDDGDDEGVHDDNDTVVGVFINL